MRKARPAATAAFSPGERDYIRRELDQFFSTLPCVADGLRLRTWRGGPHAGQPKVPAPAQGLLERGLVRLQPAPWPPRLLFTDAGLAALRAMMADGRLASPRTFAHVRRELGIDPHPAWDEGSAAGPSEAPQAAHGSRAAAFPPPPEWDNSPVPTARNAPMARTPKADPPPTPARRGRKPKAAAASPAAAPAAKGGDAAAGAAGVGVAAPGGSSTPARGRRGRKPGQQAGALEPALPLAAGMDQGAVEASPPADGPEPAGDESDTPVAEMAVQVSGEPKSKASPEAHENAAVQAGDAVPFSPPPDVSAPTAPAACWDRTSDTVNFDWPAIEQTAAQHGPNQAMAKLLLAARAEGAHSRWPL